MVGNERVVVGCAVLFATLFVALFAAQLAPYDPNAQVLTARFGPPTLLSPYQALATFAGQEDIAARALLPINLSLLAERLVSTALQAPALRTGPKPKERQLKSRSRADAEA